MIDELRRIPLQGVLISLGSSGSKRDPNYRFETPVGIITLDRRDPLKFYNHDKQIGGYGALDLVMMVKGCDFKAAKENLQGFKPAIYKAVKPKTVSAPLTPSFSVEARGKVRNYLVEKRMLSPLLVDELMATGRIFAVENATFTNAAFKFDDGKGCELRGITGTFHGCRGSKEPFSIEKGEGGKVVFVESAIEALSYLSLNDLGSIKVISTTGTAGEKLEQMARNELASGRSVVAGFNNDKAGNALSDRLLKLGATRELPIEKDWNDTLVKLSQSVKQRSAEMDR